MIFNLQLSIDNDYHFQISWEENFLTQQPRLILTSMKNGQSGKVVAINGGMGMQGRLEALGLRINSRITKKSGFFRSGPVIVSVGNTDVAIGYGMASRITVEVEV